jgi:hypothetical protein
MINETKPARPSHSIWGTAGQPPAVPSDCLRQDNEQAEAEFCRVEAGEFAVALGPPARGEAIVHASQLGHASNGQVLLHATDYAA